MNRVLFTKKHISISVLILIAIVSLSIVSWFLIIAPKSKELGELNQKLSAVNEEIKQQDNLLRKVENLPTLLESDTVKNEPVIPNGLQLQKYFDQLRQLDESLGISLQHISFDNAVIFPDPESGESGEVSAAGQLKQLQNTTVGIDILARNESDLLNFVKELESAQRFTKIGQVSYRCNPDAVGEDAYAFSASIIMQMYYISYAETGKPVE
ncbi:hypothetical protein IW492_07855 [Enterococcus sp. BWB1-3]|uniref:hypothetical protein n=1 Tax=unclassified Enterococcus TaxID=2608891 RepID=UPI0019245318|nr:MULTISPECIES: hypothetical protein [unclassified Enterococcus]MBL1229147.1 hypothetical protein [Enterococcus sp. BWB1-3]MCB5953431.1 hypothetical protein [Enterococcus sp. CWB-B31]